MNYKELKPPLRKFVDETLALLETETDEAVFLPKIGEAMQQLINSNTWLDAKYMEEHPEYYRQYLLYADPKNRLSIVSFVWGPGQSTPVHDHTIWGVIGMLEGSEYDRRYVTGADNSLELIEETQLLPGDIGFVSPSVGDVHDVRNTYDDKVSISIHAYGGNIGEVDRHIFPTDGQPKKHFKSGYAVSNN